MLLKKRFYAETLHTSIGFEFISEGDEYDFEQATYFVWSSEMGTWFYQIIFIIFLRKLSFTMPFLT